VGEENVQCSATITSSHAVFFFGDISSSSSSGSRLRLREEVAEEGDWGPGCKGTRGCRERGGEGCLGVGKGLGLDW